MGFAAAVRRFARIGAKHTECTYGGTTCNDTADANGNNLATAAGVKFRAAFATVASRREIEIQGFVVDCHAFTTVRDELGLSFVLGDELTYLPDDQVYVVCEIGTRTATSVSQRYALRRQNNPPP